MISYIKGTLAAIEGETIVVETGQIGLAVRVPASLLERLPRLGQELVVYTYFQVKEDAMTLYGFLSREDREMFKQLIGVSGIGPKGALAILSAMRPDDLRLAIMSGDAKAISKAPGIGAKTAQRMILELKDKVSPEDVLGHLEGALNSFSGAPAPEEKATAGMAQAAKDAVEALAALGYSNLEAARAVRQVEVTEGMTVEAVLKASLRHLSFL